MEKNRSRYIVLIILNFFVFALLIAWVWFIVDGYINELYLYEFKPSTCELCIHTESPGKYVVAVTGDLLKATGALLLIDLLIVAVALIVKKVRHVAIRHDRIILSLFILVLVRFAVLLYFFLAIFNIIDMPWVYP